MILRVNKRTGRYTVIDNTGLNDPRLSFKAKGILVYLLSKPDDWEIIVSQLVASGKDGYDSVMTGIRELRKYGYAELEVQRDEKGKVIKHTYNIFEVPGSAKLDHPYSQKQPKDENYPQRDFPQMENPEMGYPEGDYPQVENPLVENPNLLNTNSTHTEKVLSTDLKKKVKRKREGGKVVGQTANVKNSPPCSAAPPSREIVYPYTSESFMNAWAVWLEYRKEIKKPYKSPKSEQMALKQLANYPEDQSIAMIEQSIANGWQGIFEIKKSSYNAKSGKKGGGRQRTSNQRLHEFYSEFLGGGE